MARAHQAPVANRMPVERLHHGDAVVDEYGWMTGRNPDVLDYLREENAYAEHCTAHTADLKQSLVDEIAARTKQTDLTVPTPNGQWWYYTRSQEGREHVLYCRCPRRDGEEVPPRIPGDQSAPGEQVLLNGNDIARPAEGFAVGVFKVSPDEKLLAYSVDSAGAERFRVRIKDIGTGRLLDDVLDEAHYTCAWSRNSKYLFYVRVDHAHRPCQVWRHAVGSTSSGDVLVFEERDEKFWITVSLSRSGEYLCFRTSSATTSEVWLLDSDQPEGSPVVVRRRDPGVYYDIDHQASSRGPGRILVRHNKDAETFAVAQAAPGGGDWTVLDASDADEQIQGVIAFARHAVVFFRRGLASGFRVVDDAGAREIAFADEVCTVAPASNPRHDTSRFRFSYSSPVVPGRIYDCDLETGRLTLLRERPVLPGPNGVPYRPEDYRAVREWAVAEDGTRIPMTVVSRAGLVRDGSAPCVLYGYGSYNRPADMGFSLNRLPLLDRGFSYAVAHVRGGGDLGSGWHNAGRRMAKRTAITDFVACARHLADRRWTSPERLIARGNSAGGMLVAAAVNLAPETFGGIAARVPTADLLTTMLDRTLPLTRTERDEWGDPLTDPEAYRCLKSYSPYENVRAVRYPPVLVMASLNDTRTRHHEAAKWVARLRARATGGPFLLKTDLETGHRGRSGRCRAWRQEAFLLAWIIDTAESARASAR